jgi:hypothetical protein
MPSDLRDTINSGNCLKLFALGEGKKSVKKKRQNK